MNKVRKMPPKDAQEEKEIREFLIKTTIETLGISEKAANLRIDAILKSGILGKFGHPDHQSFQIAVDAAIQIPQIGIE